MTNKNDSQPGKLYHLPVNKDDFQIGKLYYNCSWSLGKYPIPGIKPYILDSIDDDGFNFIAPEALNAKEPLEKLSGDDKYAILNMLDKSRDLFVPHSAIDSVSFFTPEGAIEFLRKSYSDNRISSLIPEQTPKKALN